MNELLVRNRQRTRRLHVPLLRQITLALLHDCLGQEHFELGLHLVGAKPMARLNEQFLHHAGSTDVITFDYAVPGSGGLHGDIFICVDTAISQACSFGTTWQAEVVRYAVHGVLHLRGHDDLRPADRRIMKREENRLLRELARRFTLSRLSHCPRVRS